MPKAQRPCPGCGGLTWGELCQPCRRARRTRPCEGCGESFTNKDRRQRFCSKACYGVAPSRHRECEVCGADYVYTYFEQRTCGRACGAELRRREGSYTEDGKFCDLCGDQVAPHSHVVAVNCSECGKLFISRSRRQKVCTPECAYVRDKQSIIDRYHSDPAFRDKVTAAAHLRRASKLGLAITDSIATREDLLAYLMKRDRGRCGICRKPIRAKKGPRRPSIDHIVPLKPASGARGEHELANLQAAHLDCNLSKNNRGGGEQLLLLG